MSDTQGERGKTGDTGQRGQTGQTGQTGQPGGTGQTGVIGERGKTGDHGQDGIDGQGGAAGQRGAHGEPGQRGPQGANGMNARPTPIAVKVFALVTVALFLIVIGSSLAVTFRSQTNDRQDEATIADLQVTIDDLRGRVDDLNSQLDEQLSRRRSEHEEIAAGRAEEQIIEDCRDLYQEAVEFAMVGRDLEQSDLVTAIAAIPIDATPAERLEATKTAISGLNHADALLRSTSQALAGYLAIDPPPVDCPHPDSNK